MSMKRFLALATPLALLLPLSAHAGNWPAALKKDYMKDCVAAARQNIDKKKAEEYCACGADKLSANFSTAQIKQLMSKTVQPSAELRTQALDAIQSCRATAAAPAKPKK